MATSLSKFYKIWLYMLIILKYPVNKNDQEIAKLMKFFKDDLYFCPECFDVDCTELTNEIDFTEDFIGTLNNLFGVKQIKYGLMKNNKTKVVIKYLADQEKFSYILGGYYKNRTEGKYDQIYDFQGNESILKALFFEKSRIDGFQYCPAEGVDNFIKLIARGNSEFSTLVQMSVNIQPLILPILNMYNFPVPTFYGSCGFTIYESYEGLPLAHYYSHPFIFKVKIAIQLLEAALKFTEGLHGYKLYLTDMNPDNIVYNEETGKVIFIDLDNIFIVDPTSIPTHNWRHRHELIECDGCFAYVPKDICSYQESDLNIFSICQLLSEDLYGDITKGFLYPIPEDLKNVDPWVIRELLDLCMRCEFKMNSCVNRFESAIELIRLLRKLVFE